ncbi:MAG: hypothetical protein ABSH28_07040 [Acidobacteriota bacterium]|jgi:hypothetical protein
MKKVGLSLWLGGWLLVCSTLQAQEVRFPVRHHRLLKSRPGELIFGETGVEYRANEKKDARTWKYGDIQQLGLLSPKELTILTYEDSKWKLGKDLFYRFEITTGEITPALWAQLQARLTRPVVSALIPPDIVPKFTIPVKHLRGFGGTQGTLDIADQYVIYKTDAPKDSRIWRYQDITSVGTTGPYQLRLTSMDRTEGEFGGERNFVFSLKERLAPGAYDFIWWKINGSQISSFTRK